MRWFGSPSKKNLKIGVLMEDIESYEAKRFEEVGRARGHDIKILQISRCYMHISENPTVYYGDEDLSSLDAIIPRVEGDNDVIAFGADVVRQFEMMGIYTLNSSISIVRAGDKLRCFQLLSSEKMKMPTTWYACSPKDMPTVLDHMGNGPYVAKMLQGQEGNGVMILDSKTSAIGTLETFMGMKNSLLVQEFIEEAKGADLRCFVVGGKVIASMQRQAQEGEFRANIHKGGSAMRVEITPDERDISLQAARILNLSIAGVDLIRSKRGSLVLEVNSSPGLEGIEASTGLDIAGQIYAFLESRVMTTQKRR